LKKDCNLDHQKKSIRIFLHFGLIWHKSLCLQCGLGEIENSFRFLEEYNVSTPINWAAFQKDKKWKNMIHYFKREFQASFKI
jgi:hypothetical protein